MDLMNCNQLVYLTVTQLLFFWTQRERVNKENRKQRAARVPTMLVLETYPCKSFLGARYHNCTLSRRGILSKTSKFFNRYCILTVASCSSSVILICSLSISIKRNWKSKISPSSTLKLWIPEGVYPKLKIVCHKLSAQTSWKNVPKQNDLGSLQDIENTHKWSQTCNGNQQKTKSKKKPKIWEIK